MLLPLGNNTKNNPLYTRMSNTSKIPRKKVTKFAVVTTLKTSTITINIFNEVREICLQAIIWSISNWK